jgi:hypothetical protein
MEVPMTQTNKRVRARRRIVLTLGLVVMASTGIAAVGFGSGCIFDSGGYQGGGRRSGAPEPTERESSEKPTSTATSTSNPPKDSGGSTEPRDADPLEAGL